MGKTTMGKSWKEWTQENLDRKCDPEGIVRILLNNDFPVREIRSMMGGRFPEGSPLVGTGDRIRPTPVPTSVDSEGLRRKREAIVRMQRSLSKLRGTPATVDRRNALSGAEFLEQYYSANRPVLMTGLMDDWEAVRKWTPEYLKSVCGSEMVEIMAARESNARYEIDDAQHRRNVPFAEFVDMVASGSETNDYYLTARNNFFARAGMRPLLADIGPLGEYLRPGEDGNGMFFWYGPKGTVTPLHHDLMNIFMAQVRGSKQVLMIPPDDLDVVYNNRGVYSLVDAGKPDYSRYPKFRDARIHELELGPGEVLFLPAGWWHYVRALDTSITVTFNNFIFPNEFFWVHPEP
jgi:hypothetical protein